MGMLSVLQNRWQAEQYLYPRWLSQIYQRYRVPDPSHALQVEIDIEAKMLRDPDIAFAFQYRQMLAAGTGFHVEPHQNKLNPKQKARAKIEEDILCEILKFDEARRNLLYADMSGARYAQVQGEIKMLAVTGDKQTRKWAVPTKLRDMAKEDFRLVNKERGNDRIRVQQQVWSISRQGYTPLKDPYNYIQHRVNDREEFVGYGQGLREALVYVWYAKSHLFQTMAETSDRLGEGWVKIKIQTDGVATEKGLSNSQVYSDALQRAEALRQNGVFVYAEGEEIELLEQKGTGFQMVLQHYSLLQQQCSRLILGAVLPTGGDMGGTSGGGYGKAETEKTTTQAIIGTSRKGLEESLTNHLMGWIDYYNRPNFEALGLGGTKPGRIKLDDDDTLSAKESAEFYAQVTQYAKVDSDEMYSALGIKRPSDAEDSTGGEQKSAPSPFGGMEEPPGAQRSDANLPKASAQTERNGSKNEQLRKPVGTGPDRTN